MSAKHWLASSTWRLDRDVWSLIIATTLAYMAVYTTVWLAPVSFALVVAAVSYPAWRRAEMAPMMHAAPWLWLGCAMSTYLMISIAWSQDQKVTLACGLLCFLLFGGIHLAASQIKVAPTDWLEHLTRTIMVVFVVAVAFLLVEELSRYAIRRTLYWPFQAIQSGLTGIRSEIKIPVDRIKWLVTGINYVLWPALLICFLHCAAHRRQRITWQVGIATATFVLLVLSHHRTSIAAFIAASLTFCLAHFRPKLATRALGIAWICAFVLVVPLALHLYGAKYHQDPRFIGSLDARFGIWGYTAELVREQPWLGVGAGATRRLNNLGAAPGLPDYINTKRRGPHAHNIYLQSLYELGIVGSLLLAAIGLSGLALVWNSSPVMLPYLLATSATFMVTGAASYGLFEYWFMATTALAALTAVIAVEYGNRLLPPSGQRTST